MKASGPPPGGRTQVVLLLLVAAALGITPGCGDGEGRNDRAMVDPGKADAEHKAAEDALRQGYTPDKMKPKGARR